MADPFADLASQLIPPEVGRTKLRALIYGAEGTAKTVTACSVGKKRLLLEADPGGYVSLQNHPELYATTDRIPFTDLRQLLTISQAFLSKDPRFAKYDTLVIDTISQVVDADLDAVTKQARDTGKIEDLTPTWPQYKMVKDRLRRAVNQLMIEADINIVMTSHMRTEKDKNDGITRVTPDLSPSVRNSVTRLQGLIAYTTAEFGLDGSMQRKMQVHPTKNVVAKCRIGGLPAVITNPDLGKIVEDWVAARAKLVQEQGLAPASESPMYVAPSDNPNDSDDDILGMN